MAKMWGGSFDVPMHPSLENLNASIELDRRMYAQDIEASKAYAKCLQKPRLLNETEIGEICTGFDLILEEWNQEKFVLRKGDEDIHTANERRLTELIGDTAKKLHVGRSRNDQVVTDMKLWMRSNLNQLSQILMELIRIIVVRAQDEIDILMPGYTHLQRAQPVRWSHYILSHSWNLKKDCERLDDIIKVVNILPLGSGALAGNPFDIDRHELAALLGFEGVTQNSMQAVGDRDFIAEFLFWASMVGIHLSRLAEDLILYSSKEFEFVRIDQSFSTGSSLMPQKRNPDSLELIRGIGSSLFGQCCSFMMVLKSLPSTYSKDLQYDKEALFRTFDKLKSILEVASGTVETMKVNKTKCRDALSVEMLATDLAYYLVRKKVPFREAHKLAGKVVAEAEKTGVALCDMTLEELKHISPHFDKDYGNIWMFEKSVEQYQAIGGTSKTSVSNQISQLKNWLNII